MNRSVSVVIMSTSRNDPFSLPRLVWLAMLAASIAVGAFLHFPLGPVPFSLQPLFVFAAGYILGPVGGGAAMALYLLAGVVGLPVFAGGASGLGHLFGPTGGYLFGFLLAALCTGMADPRGTGLSWRRGVVWGGVALVVTYGLGATWLKLSLGMSWPQALTVGVAPFVLGDVVKVAVAVAAARYLQDKQLLPE